MNTRQHPIKKTLKTTEQFYFSGGFLEVSKNSRETKEKKEVIEKKKMKNKIS